MKIKKLLLILCVLVFLLVSGCGPIDEKQAERILSGAAQTTIAGVTFVPETPGATQDVNAIVQQTFAAMTAQAGGGQPLATPPAPTATTGSISGQLNYPADTLPSMYVTAYKVGTQSYQYVITNAGQGTFEIDNLPPGTYHVIAYTVGGGGFPAGLAGGYTKAVPCGLGAGCTDHSLIDITVSAGHNSTGVNPADFYAPDGIFPPFPGQAAQPTLPPAVAVGGISGNLKYPASGIPSLRIVAFQVGTANYYYVDTALGQSTYQINNLPPATYHVVTYVLPGGGFTGGLSGGYSQMVPCGLAYGCTDHTLIDVVVTSGNITTGVDPNDYYADPGTFPANPVP